jgi:glycyl-tRNA synthetase beta chain
MAEFLFEIGLEEIPARMIAGAQAELQKRVVAMLERERLVVAGVAVKSFSTPRRLAVWVAEVADRQGDVTEELLGPSTKIAYKDGVATPAAVAFAKKSGVAVEELKTVTTPKGEYLAATSVKAGRGAAEVIAAELPKELAGIYWAKNMYWRAGRPERFVRPVRWMLALLGESVVPVEFAGYVAGSVTYGHRVLFGEQAIAVGDPSRYEAALMEAFVVADVEVRRQKIRKALDHVTRTVAGLRWREDHGLVDKLTHLTEWPSVLLGEFEAEYLTLPEEVLVTVMRDHQSYFAVEDTEAKLAPYFLAVLNMEADEAGIAVIRHGNARVLRARFNDARFFWEFDQRVPLVERRELLARVTFQKQLGSYATKTDRVETLSRALGLRVTNAGAAVDAAALESASLLAKTDLTTELVKEFTELQGMVGGLYAKAQGHSAAVSDAIYDQYKPVSMEDDVPRTMEGALLAIADKADSVAGMFSLGLDPTGSKDPFAIRRAANGIVKILAVKELPLTLSTIIDLAAAVTSGHPAIAEQAGGDTTQRLQAFFAERLGFYLREVCGSSYDVVKTVLAVGADDVRDAVARAEAFMTVRSSADFLAVCAAFKRMNNILAQARDKGLRIAGSEIHFDSKVEADLWNEMQRVGVGFREDCDARRYVGALTKLAALRPLIDDYFNAVMVLVEDDEIRANRLGMLQSLIHTFSRIGDFSEIVIAG